MSNQRLRIVFAFAIVIANVIALLLANALEASAATETFKGLAILAGGFLFGTMTNGSKPLG